MVDGSCREFYLRHTVSVYFNVPGMIWNGTYEQAYSMLLINVAGAVVRGVSMI